MNAETLRGQLSTQRGIMPPWRPPPPHERGYVRRRTLQAGRAKRTPLLSLEEVNLIVMVLQSQRV
jgi:hypothetical protein